MQTNCLARLFLVTLALLVPWALIGCGSSNSNPGGTGTVTDYLRSCQTSGGQTGTNRTGAPTTGSSGPSANVSAPTGVVIQGGTIQIPVSSSTIYNSLALWIAGAGGYFEITGLSGGSVTLLLTVTQTVQGSFTLRVAVGSGGNYGPPQDVPLNATAVGTGDVQVNVSWDKDMDLDLHVRPPNEPEIYYGNRGPSPTGGQLDLDSNAGCVLDHKRSENITWPRGRAPSGTYTVVVDNWSACAETQTNYVVTINVTGQPPVVKTGSFVAADADHGGSGSGRVITTFTK